VHYLDLAAEEIAASTTTWPPSADPSWSEPRATSAIAEILTLIGAVLDSGNAYQAGGAVYFDVTTFPRFGDVSHFDHATMLAMAAEHGATRTTRTSATRSTSCCGSRPWPTRPAWESRWVPADRAGTSSARRWPCVSWGRRSTSTGADATSCSRTTSARRPSPRPPPASPFVRHWLHVGLVGLDGTKMSKSLGNLVSWETS